MKKKVFSIASLVVLLLSVLAVTTAASQKDSEMEAYGKYIKSLTDSKQELLEVHDDALVEGKNNKLSSTNSGKHSEKTDKSEKTDNLIKKNEFKILTYSLQHHEGLSKKESKKVARDILIERKATYKAAKKAGITVSEEEINQEIERRLNVDYGEKFDQLLDGLELTKEEFWSDYKYDQVVHELTVRKLYEQETGGKVKKSEKWQKKLQEEIKDYKEGNKNKIKEFDSEQGIE
ncbi:hypothetical protein SAMN04487936_103397 [Halobacillus dabanensis]|uniref:SurA N-terminal domain-containing protein n=1 Tax=Halobacillus dabanensis TaxID=240302 RepID=A0A1I3TIQ9_HALDA|nr:SurA N-terminal domain-containing protein [Halobacillus dabanensis]SFJ70432.1 hypothetical protein SAMN04487936_103397 [Halobacillus dabanensis]